MTPEEITGKIEDAWRKFSFGDVDASVLIINQIIADKNSPDWLQGKFRVVKKQIIEKSEKDSFILGRFKTLRDFYKRKIEEEQPSGQNQRKIQRSAPEKVVEKIKSPWSPYFLSMNPSGPKPSEIKSDTTFLFRKFKASWLEKHGAEEIVKSSVKLNRLDGYYVFTLWVK